MKNSLLIISLLLIGCYNTTLAQLTQAKIVRTGGLEITVYVKPATTINAGTNVATNFTLSLPGGTGPATLTVADNYLGGAATSALFEIVGGRKIYPIYIETTSSAIALLANTDNAIARITFPASESGDLVQINDYSGTGSNNGFFYISYSGIEWQNANALFYGTNPVNVFQGDSRAEAQVALPVTLVDFEAKKLNDKNSILSWTTASESNSSHFNLQRSTDKKAWTSFGKVNAQGNSQIIKNYEFVDENVYNGVDARLTVYYRLQMVDLDGQTKISPFESVVFGTGAVTGREILAYPNPASHGIQVEWDIDEANQPTSIELFDIDGKLVYTTKVDPNSNQEYIDFSFTDVQSGLYLLRLVNGKEPIETKQIVVQR